MGTRCFAHPTIDSFTVSVLTNERAVPPPIIATRTEGPIEASPCIQIGLDKVKTPRMSPIEKPRAWSSW